jgi:hypothetical protein
VVSLSGGAYSGLSDCPVSVELEGSIPRVSTKMTSRMADISKEADGGIECKEQHWPRGLCVALDACFGGVNSELALSPGLGLLLFVPFTSTYHHDGDKGEGNSS